jgi:hypothetical protein
MQQASAANRNSLVKTIFFGNYFYGICAIALSIEATLQQEFPFNHILYYILVFLCAVFYYTLAYMGEPASDGVSNVRSVWYARNSKAIKIRQRILLLLILVCGIDYTINIWEQLLQAPAMSWSLIFLFPAVAALYYGVNTKLFGGINLRKIGWLKPFVIGFTWAGLVTVYPIVFSSIENATDFVPGFRNVLLFIKNFMFVSVLCILFDIKDYATDANHQLKTFVVKTGLRKTIFYIIIPLSTIGLGSFLTYASLNHFSFFKILLNTIPFILLIAVAYSLHRRRPIIYYLAIIDGLLLVKAICGSIAMICF